MSVHAHHRMPSVDLTGDHKLKRVLQLLQDPVFIIQDLMGTKKHVSKRHSNYYFIFCLLLFIICLYLILFSANIATIQEFTVKLRFLVCIVTMYEDSIRFVQSTTTTSINNK